MYWWVWALMGLGFVLFLLLLGMEKKAKGHPQRWEWDSDDV